MADDKDIVLRFSRRYSMGHRLLSGAAPNCRIPHGHDEVVTVDIASASDAGLDPATNMLVEFDQAKGRWFEWIDRAVDHTFHVSDRDPLIGYFRDHEPEQLPKLLVTHGDPTTELRAACYFAKLSAFLEEGLVCTRVLLQETPSNAVEVSSSRAVSPGPSCWWNRADLSINDL